MSPTFAVPGKARVVKALFVSKYAWLAAAVRLVSATAWQGIVPGTLNMPAPLPLNVPEIFTSLAPLVTTFAGNCAVVSAPMILLAATELALAAVAAFAARTAYGVAVSGCRGLSVEIGRAHV